MTQLSAKTLARRTMTVCLMILILATGTAIVTVRQAEPIKKTLKAYADPLLQYTSQLGGTITVAGVVKALVHKGWKRV
jgi:hypothetical protein